MYSSCFITLMYVAPVERRQKLKKKLIHVEETFGTIDGKIEREIVIFHLAFET